MRSERRFPHLPPIPEVETTGGWRDAAVPIIISAGCLGPLCLLIGIGWTFAHFAVKYW
jgi:hypothetical protein